MKLLTGIYGAITAFAIVCMSGAQEKQGIGGPADAPPEPELQEKLDVYLGQLKHGSVTERRKAVDVLGRIGERAKGAEAAVPFLTESLKAEKYYTRKSAAQALWKLKHEQAALAAMIGDLKSKDLLVCNSAAQTLGEFGAGAKSAVPALVQALDDTSIRFAAAVALWQINRHPKAIPTLIEFLKYSDSPNPAATRASAARALGQIGPDAKAAVPALLEALRDEPWTAWHNSAFHIPVALALWQIDNHPSAVPALIEFLKFTGHEGYRRREAADSLREIGIDAKAAVPALAEALKDEKEYVRRAAVSALAAMGAEAKAAVPALIEAAKPKTRPIVAGPNSSKGYLGLALVRAGLHGEPYLDKLDPGSPAAKAGIMYADLFVGVNDTKINDLKDFREALQKLALRPGDEVTFAIERGEKPMSITITAGEWPGPDARVPVPGFWMSRVAAAQLLCKFKHPAGLPALTEALKDPEASTAAAESLYGMGAEAKAVMPALIDALKSENQYTRVTVARALYRLGREKEAIPVLAAELKNKDAYWRCFVALDLWRINKDPAAVTVLLEGLKDKDVRGTAAVTLWEMNRHPAAVPALVEAVKNGDERLVHIVLEGKAAVAALTDALKEEDGQVRNSAAEWLKKINPEAAKKAGVKLDESAAKEITRLIKQLGSDNFREREAATNSKATN